MLNYRRFADAWLRGAVFPLGWVDDGRSLFIVFVLSAFAGFWMYVRRGIDFGFWSGLLFVAGAMLYLESALILPYYYLVYHNALLIITLFWSFIALQIIVNAAASAGRAGRAMLSS